MSIWSLNNQIWIIYIGKVFKKGLEEGDKNQGLLKGWTILRMLMKNNCGQSKMNTWN